VLALTCIVAACTSTGGSGAASPIGSAASPIVSAVPGSLPPDSPVAGSPGAAAPGLPGLPGLPSDDAFVTPKPGQLGVHPVRAEEITAAVDGRHVILTIGWTSGVEPCYVLDSIVVDRGQDSYAITLREGHSQEGVACIEIAMRHRTQVDLGELKPGTYTITDSQGGAPAIEVVIA
jgi:hypothetical protein